MLSLTWDITLTNNKIRQKDVGSIVMFTFEPHGYSMEIQNYTMSFQICMEIQKTKVKNKLEFYLKK